VIYLLAKGGFVEHRDPKLLRLFAASAGFVPATT
jgi:hypothetical protein